MSRSGERSSVRIRPAHQKTNRPLLIAEELINFALWLKRNKRSAEDTDADLLHFHGFEYVTDIEGVKLFRKRK